MENEKEIVVSEQVDYGIAVGRNPVIVLAEAKKAAQALMTVVSQKAKPVIINGERYLEFEDWMTVARFYGLTVKVKKTQLIDLGGVRGYEAEAEVIRNSDGMVISGADAMCLNDEDKWSSRAKYEYVDGVKTKTGEIPVPLFQLRSMAQTRACAKALRNVLSWVVVLAGFKPTPAEEMTGGLDHQAEAKPEIKQPQKKVTPIAPASSSKTENPISPAQEKRLFAIAGSFGYNKEDINKHLAEKYGVETSRDIDRAWYEDVVSMFQIKFKDTNA